jgi:putative ABC transport system substrate-binding protein
MPSEAQDWKKVQRIGLLVVGSSSSTTTPIEGFLQALHDLGYVEGKNIVIEQRYADGRQEQLPHLAAELVRLKPDVIVTTGTPPTLAVKNVTQTIPVVFVSVADPINSGLVASLARPGGNITGFSTMNAGLSAKRLEILKETFPTVSRLAVLLRPDAHGETTITNMLKETEEAAHALGVRLQLLKPERTNDFDGAFSAITAERAAAVLVFPSAMFTSERKRIVNLSAKHRLPSMYPQREYVDAGGLMSYAANFSDQFYRVAIYVDKILKGAKAADLPVEQPKKFELVINLKTAKQIGLTIPPNVLARADKVIR